MKLRRVCDKSWASGSGLAVRTWRGRLSFHEVYIRRYHASISVGRFVAWYCSDKRNKSIDTGGYKKASCQVLLCDVVGRPRSSNASNTQRP